MPFIKFLSDIDCKVVIDCGTPLSLTAGSLQSIQLEPGTYWVELYNEFEDKFKEYELFADPAMAQILHRISVFDSIKNQNLELYNYDGKSKYIPVRRLDGIDYKYGFVDWGGKIVVPLIFDDAWNTVVNNPMVSRFGNDFEVLNESGEKVNFPKDEFDNLEEYQAAYKGYPVIVAYKDQKWGFLPDEGADNSNEPLINPCDKIIYYNYLRCDVVVRKNGFCEYLYYDHSRGATGIEKNISLNVDWYLPRYSSWLSPKPEYVSIYRKNHKYGFITLDNQMLVDAIYDGVYLEDSNGKISVEDDFCIVKQNTKCALAIISSSRGIEFLTPFEYDHIFRTGNPDDCNYLPSADNFLWIVKKDNHYGGINCYGQIVVPIIYKKILFKEAVFTYDENYSVFRRLICVDFNDQIIKISV